MLKIISILTLLYFISSTALPESSNDHIVHLEYKDHQPLPLKLAEAASNNYYEAGGKQAKPCSRPKDEDPLDDEELLPTPTYSARLVKTYQGNDNNNLKPQSLKNLPSEDSGEEHYNKLLKLYSHYPNDEKNQAYNSDKVHGKTEQKDKQVEGVDDKSEVSNRNALQNGEKDNVQYENKKNKAESDGLDGSEYDGKNVKSLAKNKEQDKTQYDVKNTNPQSDKLNAASHYSKNVKAQSKELDDSQSKSSNKYLTVANYKDKSANAEGDELDGADYDLEDAFNGVKTNKADSDELNEALDEIKKHLAHSEELKNALREVGRKGKIYSNVLNEALYKAKKHIAQSDERNHNRYGDGSNESDSSDADDSNDQYEKPYLNEKYKKSSNKQDEHLLKKSKVYSLSNKPVYEESDLQSQVEDSDENDQKCPSKQRNSAAEQHKGKESTRRLLSDSKDSESESLNSVLSKDVAQKDGKLKNKAKHSSAKIAQKHTVQKSKANKYNDEEDDSRTAEEKEGDQQLSAVNDASLRRNPLTKYSFDLSNPVQAPGVSELSPQGLSLMDHRRVCYACSSDFNPSCYEPNRQTTVKYCHFGHENCITKTYTDPNDHHPVVIRDCGDLCNVRTLGSGEIWNSCDVCKDDLCNDKKIEPNSAFSINSQSLMFTVFVIVAIKFTI